MKNGKFVKEKIYNENMSNFYKQRIKGKSMLEEGPFTKLFDKALKYHHSFEMKKTLNNSSKKYEPILDTAEPFG